MQVGICDHWVSPCCAVVTISIVSDFTCSPSALRHKACWNSHRYLQFFSFTVGFAIFVTDTPATCITKSVSSEAFWFSPPYFFSLPCNVYSQISEPRSFQNPFPTWRTQIKLAGETFVLWRLRPRAAWSHVLWVQVQRIYWFTTPPSPSIVCCQNLSGKVSSHLKSEAFS